MIKSPLRYPGGKSKAVDLISTIIPPFDEYREPFAGGASVFFYLKQIFPDKTYWINDLYFELFNFWIESRDNLGSVASQVEKWRKSFSAGKQLHKYLIENIKTFSPIERAAAFFTFNRITFSGTTESGGYSEQAYKLRFTPSSVQRLKAIGGVLQGTTITNLDYGEVVKQHGKNVFIFLDPPYFSSVKSALYGKNGNLHKGFDHARFAESMKNCKHQWLITYDDSAYIRDLFSFANVQNWNLTYGMRNITPASSQIGKELFISNYPILLPEKLQLQLFEQKNKYNVKKKVTKQTQ